MTSQEILTAYIDFFKARGHVQIPNVSLVPENDPTLLFVNSGMFPLVPYLSGQAHPSGKRLVNVQRAGRFQEDLAEVGDNRHTTAFHMMGNWSLGDYFNKEQLPWIYEFFIEKCGLDAHKMYATVFAGDESAPKDNESIEIIQEIFKKYGIDAQEGSRIFACGKESNWWKRGDTVGELGGPDSEIYYFVGEGDGFGKNPIDDQENFIEIGNSVFMQYKKTADGSWEELSQKNVDFGGGLERIAMVVQKKKDVFETDNFWPTILKIQELSGKKYNESPAITKAMRVLADHIRGCVFLAMDGVLPSRKDQGYMLRRLLRRMIRAGWTLGINKDISVNLVAVMCDTLSWLYPDLKSKQKKIQNIFKSEEEKFIKTLQAGAKEVDRILTRIDTSNLNQLVVAAFDLYQSLGYPEDMFLEDLKDRNVAVDSEKLRFEFNKMVLEHQSLSRTGAEAKFKGGLADQSKINIKYHTATHLLQMALRQVLGDNVAQKGSNITNERLRFDFNFAGKLSADQILKVENIVNDVVAKGLPVNFVTLPRAEAEKTGALHAFGEKYGDTVTVYFIGESLESAVSKEFCGGPHVSNTSELGKLAIYKQEKIGDGVLRVYGKFD